MGSLVSGHSRHWREAMRRLFPRSADVGSAEPEPAPGRMELIVHAGFPKTGSSALQYWLDTNASALADAGVLYPRVGRSAEDAPGNITAGNGKLLSHYLVPKLRHWSFEIDDFPAKFRRTFIETGHERVLISREQIGASDADMLRRFKDEIVPDVQLTFVIFIRDLYNLARASWTQHIKRHVMTCDLKEYAAENGSNVGNLQDIVDVLGRENVRVLHYDSETEDLVGAFLNAIGVDPAIGTARSSVGRINRSLSDAEARVLMECGQAHGQRKLARLLSNHFMDQYRNSPSTHIPDPEIANMLVEKHARKMRWVNETFFDGRDVFGVGGPSQTRREETGSPEMSEGEVWREIALVLAKEFVRRLGRSGGPKIMEMIFDHFRDEQIRGGLTLAMGSSAASASSEETESKLRQIEAVLFGNAWWREAGGGPRPDLGDDRNGAIDDQVWREAALILAKALSERIGPKLSREELRQGLGKKARMARADGGPKTPDPEHDNLAVH